jgi:hypothetical protein
MQENWTCEVSRTHVCQCQFTILWQGFSVASGKVFVCRILEKVANIKMNTLFHSCEHDIVSQR